MYVCLWMYTYANLCVCRLLTLHVRKKCARTLRNWITNYMPTAACAQVPQTARTCCTCARACARDSNNLNMPVVYKMFIYLDLVIFVCWSEDSNYCACVRCWHANIGSECALILVWLLSRFRECLHPVKGGSLSTWEFKDVVWKKLSSSFIITSQESLYAAFKICNGEFGTPNIRYQNFQNTSSCCFRCPYIGPPWRTELREGWIRATSQNKKIFHD